MFFLIRITVFPQRKTASSISEQDTWVAEKGIVACFMDKEVSGLTNRFQGEAQTWATTIVSYWNGLNNTQNYEIEKNTTKKHPLAIIKLSVSASSVYKYADTHTNTLPFIHLHLLLLQ